MTRVLVVDDEAGIRQVLRVHLGAAGLDVALAEDGEAALGCLGREPVDAALVDLELPDMEGVDLIRAIRGWSSLPVIVLSIREAQDEKVAALEASADDYVQKPFGTREVLARLRAVLRRATGDPQAPVLRFGELEVHLPHRLVLLHGERVPLSRTEYRLLEAFVTNPNKPLTHEWLIGWGWGPGRADQRSLRVHIRNLRRKLGGDPAKPKWIATETGIGYRWIREVETEPRAG